VGDDDELGLAGEFVDEFPHEVGVGRVEEGVDLV
jgi:hypothetical protein